MTRATSATKTRAGAPPTELGALLRHWRDARGKSQFDLSLDTGVSQRHLSFIESGRSVPGRQTLMDVAEALDVPLRDRNALLLAAGYAPLYPDGAWNAVEMRSVTSALERILRQHEPFPAIAMDRDWNVLVTNDAAPRFFNRFVDLAARPSPRNLLHLMFDPAGMRPFIAHWDEVAKSLIQRVYREAVGRVVDDRAGGLLDALLAYPGVDPDWRHPKSVGATSSGPALPFLPIGFVRDGRVMNYFSMITTVGTPQTVAAQELRIECLFPVDDATESLHARLMAESDTR